MQHRLTKLDDYLAADVDMLEDGLVLMKEEQFNLIVRLTSAEGMFGKGHSWLVFNISHVNTLMHAYERKRYSHLI